MSLRHQEAIALPAAPEAPEDRIVAGDDERMVLEGLRSLPPRQRDCMVLRFYFDLTEREIGETLGISPNSVKTHCRRGMASLRDRLEAADGR